MVYRSLTILIFLFSMGISSLNAQPAPVATIIPTSSINQSNNTIMLIPNIPTPKIIGGGGGPNTYNPLEDEDYQSPRAGQIEINHDWFYTNSGVPQILKDILKQGAVEEIIDNHAYDLHVGCRTYLDSGLEEFITGSISPLFRNKPAFCRPFISKQRVEETISQLQFTMPSSQNDDDQSEDDSIDVTLAFDDWTIDPTQLNSDLFVDPLDKFVISQISKFQGAENPTVRIPVPSEENQVMSLYGNQSQDTSPPRELISAGLLRLWGTLSLVEQMQILRNCPTRLSLNSLRGFWSTSNSEVRGNPANYQLGLRLCQTEKLEDIIPLIDKSLLSEYMLNITAGESFDTSKIINLCEAWPEVNLATTSHFPPPTSSDELFFNVGEFHRESTIYSDDTLALFNPYDLNRLTTEQRNALEAYTSANYNAMNAYQMWGRLGLFFLNRSNQSELSEGDKDRTGLTEEARAELINSRDVYQTMHGEYTADAVRNLRDALTDMDQYTGVTFSAQKLSGHFFTSLRVGSTFEPSFFMSTSTELNVALNFLDTEPDNTDERYLFVVSNRTGVPLTNHSQYSAEQEVLVHPDAQFEVLAVEPFMQNGVINEHIKVVYIAEKP